MANDTRKKLLKKLAEQYEVAAKNPNVKRVHIRNLYFELNSLRSELAKMSEDELKQVDKMYSEATS